MWTLWRLSYMPTAICWNLHVRCLYQEFLDEEGNGMNVAFEGFEELFLSKTMNKELWSVIFHTMSLRNAAIRCSSSHFVMFNTVNNINGLPNCMSFWVWAQSHHLLVLPHIVHESALGKITSSFIWPPSFLRILHYRSSYRHLCGNSSLLRINVTWSETILN